MKRMERDPLGGVLTRTLIIVAPVVAVASNDEKPLRFQRSAREHEDGLGDNRDDDRFDAVEKTKCRGKFSVALIPERNGRHDQRSGQNETDAREKKPAPSCAFVPDEDRNFRRARSGNQARGANEIEKLFAREPFQTANELLFHHRDVSGWSSECDRSQSQESPRKLHHVGVN